MLFEQKYYTREIFETRFNVKCGITVYRQLL